MVGVVAACGNHGMAESKIAQQKCDSQKNKLKLRERGDK